MWESLQLTPWPLSPTTLPPSFEPKTDPLLFIKAVSAGERQPLLTCCFWGSSTCNCTHTQLSAFSGQRTAKQNTAINFLLHFWFPSVLHKCFPTFALESSESFGAKVTLHISYRQASLRRCEGRSLPENTTAVGTEFRTWRLVLRCQPDGHFTVCTQSQADGGVRCACLQLLCHRYLPKAHLHLTPAVGIPNVSRNRVMGSEGMVEQEQTDAGFLITAAQHSTN